MFCHHGKHPSNEQRSQISDSPRASAALAGRRLKQRFSLETTESINSACKRITLLEWRTGSFIIHTPSSTLFFTPSFPLFLFPAVYFTCVSVFNRVLCVGSLRFVSPVSGCQRAKKRAQDDGDTWDFGAIDL